MINFIIVKFTTSRLQRAGGQPYFLPVRAKSRCVALGLPFWEIKTTTLLPLLFLFLSLPPPSSSHPHLRSPFCFLSIFIFFFHSQSTFQFEFTCSLSDSPGCAPVHSQCPPAATASSRTIRGLGRRKRPLRSLPPLLSLLSPLSHLRSPHPAA